MVDNSNNIIEKIVSFLKKNIVGSTPSDISRRIGVNRMTVSKYLNILKAVNLVKYKGVGMAKIYFLNETPIFTALSEPENDYFKAVKKAIDDVGIGISIIDKDLKIVWFNRNMQNWTGKKAEASKGLHCYCTFKNNKSVCENCPGALTLRDGKVHKAVQDGIDKDGKTLFFQLTTSALYDLNNKVVGFVEVVKDLDDLREIVKDVEEFKKKIK